MKGKIREYIFTKLRKRNLALINYKDDRKDLFNFVKKARIKNRLGMHDCECMQLLMAVKNTSKLGGNIAEVGVWKGGSAELIYKIKDNRKLYLFDNFEDGIPEVSKVDDLKLRKGDYASSYTGVKEIFKNYSDVFIFKGIFPDTSKPILGKKFSFVNLDIDTYKSTLDCLNFFYKRMLKGGIIISHDYNSLKGVKKAIDKFFSKKKEVILELAGTQCLIVKL